MTNALAIGIILDGNRRWAKERDLPSLEGHRAGFEKLKEVLEWAKERGVGQVTVYAFSTENWNRSPEEVSYLMDLFEHAFDDVASELEKTDGRLKFIGERDRLPAHVQKQMEKAEEATKNGTGMTFVVAISYGGRPEIIAAVNKLLKEGKQSIDEASFSDAMWSAGLKDPDLIIRTSGEQRLSNFLPWQSIYSELFFTDTKWPDFSKEEFERILTEYESRQRRRGR